VSSRVGHVTCYLLSSVVDLGLCTLFKAACVMSLHFGSDGTILSVLEFKPFYGLRS
jgi:hypothetical protein